ncbi:TIGR03364 family FAD-dependent oxidoreductase [Larkinella soli]|uniref:TIGR03364 family FAD-dependent oxidoreductase n=1 Tax=Larkinella soli TaxID=1770527 RepID=UPI000FFB13C6|nr:TIGR03364 family FAD-dependent oxidoreductase [Larkinella soli]
MTYDLIVVGGGIVGTFHAYHAAVRGLKVLLLEKDAQPHQATVRNFGQIVPSGMSGRWFAYGRRGLEIYGQIQQEFDLSLRRNGSVYIASDEDEQTLLHEVKARFDAESYASELLTADRLLERYPVIRRSYAREALFFPQELSAEPNQFIHRLHQYMAGRFPNLTLQFRTAVVGCDPSESHVTVRSTAGETWQAGKVIVCGGGEFRLLFPNVFRTSGIITSKLQMMRTVALPDLPLEGNILTGLTIRRYESFTQCPSYGRIRTPEPLEELKRWGIHILFKKAVDGSVIIGDSHEYASVDEVESLGYHTNAHLNELMLREAQRIVTFDVRALSETWSGFYPQHGDHDVYEHDIGNSIHIRTAIGGKGMTGSCGYAEEVIATLFG